MPQQNGQPSQGEFKLKQILAPLAVIIPLAVAGNILYIILSGRPGMLRGLVNFHIGYLLLAVLLVFVPWFTHSVRMLLWSRIFGQSLRPLQAFKTSVAAEVGSAVTPTSVGGGYIKLGFMIGYGFGPAQATLVMVLGTIEDALFLGVALPLAVARTRAWDNPYVARVIDNIASRWPILLTVALLAALVYYAIRRFKLGIRNAEKSLPAARGGLMARIKGGLRHYGEELRKAVGFALRKGKGTFAVCVLLTGIGWSCRYGAISALAWGLGYPVDPVLLFLLQWVIFSTMALVPTPGAIGGAEVAFAVVHQNIFPGPLLPLLTGAWRFLTYYLLAMVGAIFLAVSGVGFGNGRNDKKINVFEEQKA